MDYASFYVHQGRIYLQKREYAQAVTVLEKGYDLRIKNLQAETPGEIHSYNDNRIGAVASLLKEAYARLAETGTLLPPIATISQTGSPLHSRRTAPAHSSSVSEADLAATQRRNNM